MNKIIALFPGQGSQKIGMGKELASSSDEAAEIFRRAEKALGFSLADICFNGPEEKLTATAIAQPAILTVSTICFEIFRGKKAVFSCAAGHSLGEYSALVAAGAISYDDAVALVHKRGRYMQEAVAAGAGKMIAVLGKEIPEIEQALTQVTEGVAEIANDNSPGQVVAAGDVAGIDQLQKILAGSKIVELKVSAPFHCRLMKSAEVNLRKDLAVLNVKLPEFPVISNYHARPLDTVDEIRESLALQVCGRVRWVESMRCAISHFQTGMALEFGAGNVLTGLLKRIDGAVERKNIASIADAEAFNAD